MGLHVYICLLNGNQSVTFLVAVSHMIYFSRLYLDLDLVVPLIVIFYMGTLDMHTYRDVHICIWFAWKSIGHLYGFFNKRI